MGGIGSGRDGYAVTPTVAECHTVTVDSLTDLVKHVNASTPYQWRDENGHGEEVASILIRSVKDGEPILSGGAGTELETAVDDRPTHLVLEYTATPPNGEAREITDRIPLEYTACNFGGVRPWFRCPDCRERIGKLHRPRSADVFRCRECYDLGYRSSRSSGDDLEQAELRYRRAFSKADARDRRPHPNDFGVFRPERPKGMHKETYDRLVDDVDRAHREWHERFRRRLRKWAPDR